MDSVKNLRELALFAGAGGGILGGRLLGWQTICAVECDPYAASVLIARQNDGSLNPFPIWDDVCTFDGKPWKGKVDVISGGFPCQDISCAGKGKGIENGHRSGLWREFARIIREIQPRYAFVENSPLLVRRGIEIVLRDLSEMGYDVAWGVLGADDIGAPHQRKRIWMLAQSRDSDSEYAHTEQGFQKREQSPDTRRIGTAGNREGQGTLPYPASERRDALPLHAGILGKTLDKTPTRKSRRTDCPQNTLSDASVNRDVRRNGELSENSSPQSLRESNRRRSTFYGRREWWRVEPGMGRVAYGVENRMDRLKCLGNGQVPLCAATAIVTLKNILDSYTKVK